MNYEENLNFDVFDLIRVTDFYGGVPDDLHSNIIALCQKYYELGYTQGAQDQRELFK